MLNQGLTQKKNFSWGGGGGLKFWKGLNIHKFEKRAKFCILTAKLFNPGSTAINNYHGNAYHTKVSYKSLIR